MSRRADWSVIPGDRVVPRPASSHGLDHRARPHQSGYREQRSLAARSLLLSCVLLCASIGAFIFVLVSPVFRISHIVVVGAHVPANQLAAAARISGKNIFTVRTADILRRLQQIPEVIITGVSLDLPNTLTISAQLRRPVVAWAQVGALYLVDGQGRVLYRVQHTNLPIVHDYTSEHIRPGDYLNAAVTRAVIYTQQMLANSRIEEYSLGQQRGIIIRSADGWQAVLGIPTGRALATRIAILRALLTQTQHHDQHLLYVDLRYRIPYATFAGG
jgi:cell division septal protein FtsQ